MKSTIRSIVVHSSALAAALSVLALAGCQKNGFDTVYTGGDSVIRFAPSVAVTESATKGALINTTGSEKALTEISEFIVSAWDNSSPAENIIPSGSKVVSRNSGEYWITVYGSGDYAGKDKEYLWREGETKTFYAYANLPSTSGAASITNTAASQVLTYDVSKVATDNLQTDILMAYYTNGSTPKTSGLVPLTFYHPLTSVVFKQGNLLEGTVIKSISIDGVYPSGKTAQNSATSAFSWTKTDGTAFGTDDETQTVSLSSVTVNSDTKQIGTALLLIPQAFSSSSKTRIKVVLKDAADASKTLDLYYPLNINIGTESPAYTSWKAGYTNIYTINFNGGGYTIDGPDEYNGSPLGGDDVSVGLGQDLYGNGGTL